MRHLGRTVLALAASAFCSLALTAASAGAAGGGPTGVVFYYEATDTPPSVGFRQEIAEDMFDPGSPADGFTVQNYFRTQTFGAVDFSGSEADVFGPYEVTAPPLGCPFGAWDEEAAAKAETDGFKASHYSQVLYVFQNQPSTANPCAAAGAGGGEVAWVNGLDPYTIVRELGHVLGSPDAAAYRCFGPGHVPVAYSAECAEVEPPGEEAGALGDPFDPMGSGRKTSSPLEMSAWRKLALGAIPEADAPTVIRDGTYTIAPLEQSSGVRLLRIPNGAGEFLDLDFRQRIGFFDETYPANDPGIHGVAIHLDPAGFGRAAHPSRLLDANPQTSTFDDAPLTPGQRFHDFRSELTIETVSTGVSGATVKIGGLPEPVVATPRPKATGCRVPHLKGKTLKAARKALDKHDCRPGKVKRRHSGRVPKGSVIAQRPRAGRVIGAGGRVAIVVSSGPKPKRR
jgi:PASTA domain